MSPPNLTQVANGDAAADHRKPPPSITISDGIFSVNGHTFLHDVPSNIVATSSSSLLPSAAAVDATGCFVGFDSPGGAARSYHVAPLGRLLGIRFMSIFRFKVWWTTHWTGQLGRDVEHETQFILLDRSGDRPYVLLLPLLEGSFRASLQPGHDDYIDICIESGSTRVIESTFRSVLYIHSGTDPFRLINDAMRAVRAHLGTFRLLEEKSPPSIVDKFGWCTWDAFYLKVHPAGVWDGVSRLVAGGCPPGLVLIDDGWQCICHDEDDPNSGQEGMNRTSAGEQMPCRLTRFEENYKFRDYKSAESGESGMGAFTGDLRREFPSVEEVYVWHALCGYWGGLRPGSPGLPESRVVKPKLSAGLETTMEDLAVDKIVKNGVGLVLPEKVVELYDGLHRHLAAVGITGVKVDVIHLLEMLCEDYGGRVELGKAYYRALGDSVKKHFKGNDVIASMEHCNDFMYLGTEVISLGRVGDDFWCTDPSGDPNGTFWLQGCHMVHCAYNSLWMGQFIHPDWDMFQSTHPCAHFHAASRAISGGPIYVSDSVGAHDFDLLRRLVLPNGTVLRCRHHALPTRDCLFLDPLHDGTSMLKIWNLNKCTGVIGVFNCQGGGWCRETRRNKAAPEFSHAVTATARPSDVEWWCGKSPIPVDGVELFAVYYFRGKKLLLLKPDDGVEISLEPFDFELLTVSPVTELEVSSPAGKSTARFASIGLANMLNSGGAVESVDAVGGDESPAVRVAVRGAGEMKAFSSVRPRACRVNGEETVFVYEEDVVGVHVTWPGSSEASLVEYLF